MCVHVHIDNVGRFLETDEFYRNQFETGTSCGALDDGNVIRKAPDDLERSSKSPISGRNPSIFVSNRPFWAPFGAGTR